MVRSGFRKNAAWVIGALAAAAALVPLRQAMAVPASITEASGYTKVYAISLPDRATFNSATIPYTVDNHASIATGSFSRIAYYLELQKAGGPLQYVYASMNAFTTDAALIGIPNTASGAFFQRNVANMNVVSNVAGVVTGTGIATGNIEFWHTDYDTANSAGVPGASATTYDFGDKPVASRDYGSFQVNNYGANQTVFAYNQWGGDEPSSFSDLGIGNQATGNPDWTFARNAGTYTVKNLEVLVQLDATSVAEPASLAILGAALTGAGLLRRRRLS